MKRVELYARVRHAVMIEGLSQREAARRFGIDPRTVKKMLRYSVPPGQPATPHTASPHVDQFYAALWTNFAPPLTRFSSLSCAVPI